MVMNGTGRILEGRTREECADKLYDFGLGTRP